MSKDKQKRRQEEITSDNKIIEEGYREVKNAFRKERPSGNSNKKGIRQYYI